MLSFSGLVNYLKNKHSITIAKSQERELRNIGYYHGYKGYRFIRDSSNKIPFTNLKEISTLNKFDLDLKTLMYPKIMYIETALKSFFIESVLDDAQSEKMADIYSRTVTEYKEYQKGSKKYGEAFRKRMNLQMKIDSALIRDYQKGKEIEIEGKKRLVEQNTDTRYEKASQINAQDIHFENLEKREKLVKDEYSSAVSELDSARLTKEEIYKLILNDKLSINEGMLFENMVAQMLKANGHRLFYYTRYNAEKHRNDIEIDFLLSSGGKTKNMLIPIEVKSGKRYQTKSLKRFKETYKNRIAQSYIIHPRNLSFKEDILCIPPYMVFCL